MTLSFSDVPTEALRQRLTQCLHILGEIERLAYHVGVAEDGVIQLSQAAMMITLAGQDLLDNEASDARTKIMTAVEQLTQIASRLDG